MLGKKKRKSTQTNLKQINKTKKINSTKKIYMKKMKLQLLKI
jgi:hypothetical protein